MKNILGIIAILVWTISAGGLIFFSGILNLHQHIGWSILIGNNISNSSNISLMNSSYLI